LMTEPPAACPADTIVAASSAGPAQATEARSKTPRANRRRGPYRVLLVLLHRTGRERLSAISRCLSATPVEESLRRDGCEMATTLPARPSHGRGASVTDPLQGASMAFHPRDTG
jgi:hypothetical protein